MPSYTKEHGRIYRACEHKWFDTWDWLVNAVLRAVGPPVIEVAAGEIAIDLHIHTLFSRCSISRPDRIILHAARLGLGGVGIMDHNDPDGIAEAQRCADDLKSRGLIHEDFLIIPGVEISTDSGHMGALFVNGSIEGERSPADTVRAIHDAGGLAIALHPFNSMGIGDALFDIPIDAVETHSGSVFSSVQAERSAGLVNDSRLDAVAKLGSSDAHYVNGIGSCYTVFRMARPTLEAARTAILSGEVRPRHSDHYLKLQRILNRIPVLR